MIDKESITEKLIGATESILQSIENGFLVKLHIKSINNVKVFVDTDSGIQLDQTIQINKGIRKFIEEEKIFNEEEFSLEVSSPGISEPLVLTRQFEKNIGRKLNIIFIDAERTALEGKLVSVTNTEIVLVTTTGKGKKMIEIEHKIPYEAIKQAIVQVSF